MFNNFLSENCTVYEIMWKKYCRDGHATDDNIILRMLFAGCIPKATDTHSQYVILIVLPLRQWLHKRVSVLMYVHCLSCTHLSSVPQVAC